MTHFTPGEQVAYPADTLRPQVTFQVRPAQYQWDRNRAAAQPRLFFGVEVIVVVVPVPVCLGLQLPVHVAMP